MALITPYGGKLVSLMAPVDVARAASLPSIQISERSQCDLELLATGAFSPLDRFMSHADYRSVLDRMHLANGTLFPIPVTLPVDADAPVEPGRELALRSAKNEILATMTVDEIYEWDRDEASRKILGTTGSKHPLAAEMAQWGQWNISGPLRVSKLPAPADFRELRRTPAEVRSILEKLDGADVVAFQTQGPLHGASEELIRRAAAGVNARLLLQAAVGMTKSGDVSHYTRVKTYKALAERYGTDNVVLAVLPLAARMAGAREALWHLIIGRNYGANHFIVGGPLDTQGLVAKHAPATGVKLVAVDGLDSTPRMSAPRDRQGFCIWLTGLSGAGKSSTADVLLSELLERGRQVTLLDGDVVRTHLSKGLGFSKEDRDTNILRIGFVAAEIVRHGGAVICAAVSPYRETRDRVRQMVGSDHFIEVFVDTPLDICESRDVKGMYARARSGQLPGFTGIDDPYEQPLAPEVTLDTVRKSAGENAAAIISLLEERQFVS